MKTRTSADDVEDRLLLGGAIIFSSAVLIQLIQVPTLSLALWISLTACAIALPLLASALAALSMHEHFAVRVDTPYTKWLAYPGFLATFVCATSVFWHLSWLLGVLFAVCSIAGLGLSWADSAHNEKLNLDRKS